MTRLTKKVVRAYDIIEEAEKKVNEKIEARVNVLIEAGDKLPDEDELVLVFNSLIPYAIETAMETYEGQAFEIIGRGKLKTAIGLADMHLDSVMERHAGAGACIDGTLSEMQAGREASYISDTLGTGMSVTVNPLSSPEDYNWALGARGEEASPIYGRQFFLEGSTADRREKARGMFSNSDFGGSGIEEEVREKQRTNRPVDWDKTLEKIPRKYDIADQTYILNVEKTLLDAGFHSSSPGYTILHSRLITERDDPEKQDKLMMRYAEVELGLEE